MTDLVRHDRRDVGGVRLHWVEEGEGEPVVLLHGFPDFWYGWRYQIPHLADAGYRVVAPDLRGYNASDKPEDVDAYRLDVLVDDVLGLMEVLGEERVSLVGHDWGGVVGWRLAARAPERVRRLVVLNAPHPGAYRRDLLRTGQLFRSWYIFFFQLPWLPEALFRAFDYERLERVIRRDIQRTEVLLETDFVKYAEALSRPGALRAMISYYRASFRGELRRAFHRLWGLFPWTGSSDPETSGSWTVPVPTLVIWGDRDRYLGSHLTEGLERWVPDVLVERIADAGHWVQVEAHERVNRLLEWFLKGGEGGGDPVDVQ